MRRTALLFLIAIVGLVILVKKLKEDRDGAGTVTQAQLAR
jgi:hypothetical protein